MRSSVLMPTLPGRRTVFLEVMAADEKQVAERLDTLPFNRCFESRIYLIAPDTTDS